MSDCKHDTDLTCNNCTPNNLLSMDNSDALLLKDNAPKAPTAASKKKVEPIHYALANLIDEAERVFYQRLEDGHEHTHLFNAIQRAWNFVPESLAVQTPSHEPPTSEVVSEDDDSWKARRCTHRTFREGDLVVCGMCRDSWKSPPSAPKERGGT